KGREDALERLLAGADLRASLDDAALGAHDELLLELERRTDQLGCAADTPAPVQVLERIDSEDDVDVLADLLGGGQHGLRIATCITRAGGGQQLKAKPHRHRA